MEPCCFQVTHELPLPHGFVITGVYLNRKSLRLSDYTTLSTFSASVLSSIEDVPLQFCLSSLVGRLLMFYLEFQLHCKCMFKDYHKCNVLECWIY